jgi:3'-phosphoadenosine 5'-phosphosulfate sulfotransferase (PAPS reductase)/FAD synthetase
VVHADLGEVEWQGTREHAEQQAARYGLPFVVAKARIGADLAERLGVPVGSPKTFMQMVDSRFLADPTVPSFPSPKYRQCTSNLKSSPLNSAILQYAREHGATLIVSAVGIRAAESPNRAKIPVWKREEELSKRGREWWTYLPIHGMSRRKVFQVIAAAGGKPHWAYAAGNERLSCVFCIMGSKGDLRRGAIHNPDLYQAYVDKERQTGHTLLMSREPLETAVGMTVEEARAKRRLLPVIQESDYDRLAESDDHGAGCDTDDGWGAGTPSEGAAPARRRRPG